MMPLGLGAAAIIGLELVREERAARRAAERAEIGSGPEVAHVA